MQMKHERAISSITSNNFLMHFVTPKTNHLSHPIQSVNNPVVSVLVRNQQAPKSVAPQTSILTLHIKHVRSNSPLYRINNLWGELDVGLIKTGFKSGWVLFLRSKANAIRIYKDDIHKIIVSRYSKDRITTFLDT